MKKINMGIVKNILMVASSNILVLLLGVIISFVLPIFLSIEDYGYWQLYNYYIGFVGLFMFGFTDGMNLRYAGRGIKALNSDLFRFFFKVICILSLFFSIVTMAVVFFTIDDINYRTVYLFVALNIFIFNINGFFIHINQMTLQFNKYSVGNILERVIFVASLIPLYFLDQRNFSVYILVNILCRLCVLFYNYQVTKSIFVKHEDVQYEEIDYRYELIENFKSGMPLTLATIFAILMTSTPRFIVDKTMDIATYGIFSFGNATINLVLQIIVAMSAVFYPTLKTVSVERQKAIFKPINNGLAILCGASFLSYYAVYYLIVFFFPKYSSVLSYLYILFPTIIYQSLNSLVVSNYARVFRLERKYFVNNAIFTLVNLGVTFLVAITTHSLIAILAVSLGIMQLWIISGNNYINKVIGERDHSNSILTLVIVSGFILFNGLLDGYIALGCYLILLAVVIFISWKKDLVKM